MKKLEYYSVIKKNEIVSVTKKSVESGLYHDKQNKPE
jgi:hypothetical protein